MTDERLKLRHRQTEFAFSHEEAGDPFRIVRRLFGEWEEA